MRLDIKINALAKTRAFLLRTRTEILRGERVKFEHARMLESELEELPLQLHLARQNIFKLA